MQILSPSTRSFTSTLFIPRPLALGLTLLAVAALALLPPTAQGQQTAFTYQAQLQQSGSPIDGTKDLRFTLYDSMTGGAQVGSAVTKQDVTVSNGILTTSLDFGAVFAGGPRFIEVGVRDGGSTDSFTTLSPRTALRPAPLAMALPNVTVDQEGKVGVATSSPSSPLTVNGTIESSSGGVKLPDGTVLAGSGDLSGAGGDITAVNTTGALEGGGDSGDVTLRLATDCSSGQIFKWDGSSWACSTDNAEGGLPTTSSGAFDLSNDGGLLAGGTFDTGSIPASGSGTRMMWYPAKGAFRAGRVGHIDDGTQWDDAQVGNYSVAFGLSTEASGPTATAMGAETIASGDHATATGDRTTASGLAAAALGLGTEASGQAATATGSGTTASGEAATAMGEGTTANGTRATAMGFSTTAIGLAGTAMGNQTTAGNFAATAMGDQTKASGETATAMGDRTTASENSATAMGSLTSASGSSAMAMGSQTTASASSATAMGARTTAGGARSTAMGRSTTASGLAATAMGVQTTAATNRSLSIGQFNSANTSDDGSLFVAGDGTASSRSDALVLKKDGDLALGPSDPQDLRLHVAKDRANAGVKDSPESNMVLFENTNSGDFPDVLGLQAGPTDPAAGVTYVSFYQRDGTTIGTIEGNGNGGVNFNTTGSDYAEELPMRPGTATATPTDLVAVRGGEVTLDTEAADRLMIVTDRAAVTGNAAPNSERPRVPVAFVGQVPVRLSGTADVGDLIVASGKDDGTARAVAPAAYRPDDHGSIAGRAWSAKSATGVGTVTVAVGLDQSGALVEQLKRQRTRIQEQNEQIQSQDEELESLKERVRRLEALIQEQNDSN